MTIVRASFVPGPRRGRPKRSSGEFVMVTVWENLDALRAFAGDDYEQPVLYADEAELLEEIALRHCEGLA